MGKGSKVKDRNAYSFTLNEKIEEEQELITFLEGKRTTSTVKEALKLLKRTQEASSNPQPQLTLGNLNVGQGQDQAQLNQLLLTLLTQLVGGQLNNLTIPNITPQQPAAPSENITEQATNNQPVEKTEEQLKKLEGRKEIAQKAKAGNLKKKDK